MTMDIRDEVAGARAAVETGLVGVWRRNKSHIVTGAVVAVLTVALLLALRACSG